MSSSPSDGDKAAIAAQRAKSGFVFREDAAPGLLMEMALHGILHSAQSDFQEIQVIDTYFGKTLVTDGKTQSAQFDEFAYHESLVHPPFLAMEKYAKTTAKKVFIGGGGELATAREVLRHTSVERLVMVDLDKVVVDVCVDHLPEWGGNTVKSDPRLELIIGDAHKYLMETEEIFDIIIMDISDPIEAGPGIMLYTKEFYEYAKTRLSPNGVFVTQAGTADAIPAPHTFNEDGDDDDDKRNDTTCFGPIRNTLDTVFDCVIPYSMCIPSFGSDWGFVMAFSSAENAAGITMQEFQTLPVSEIDVWIESSIDGGEASLRMYDGMTHHRMFALTKPIRKQLKKDKRVMTVDNPVFMY